MKSSAHYRVGTINGGHRTGSKSWDFLEFVCLLRNTNRKSVIMHITQLIAYREEAKPAKRVDPLQGSSTQESQWMVWEKKIASSETPYTMCSIPISYTPGCRTGHSKQQTWGPELLSSSAKLSFRCSNFCLISTIGCCGHWCLQLRQRPFQSLRQDATLPTE